MNPDFIIDGEFFDHYAPITRNVINIRYNILNKISHSLVKNIILNLRDTSVTVKQIDDYLLFYPVDGLEKLWIIDKWGEIHYLRGGKE